MQCQHHGAIGVEERERREQTCLVDRGVAGVLLRDGLSHVCRLGSVCEERRERESREPRSTSGMPRDQRGEIRPSVSELPEFLQRDVVIILPR